MALDPQSRDKTAFVVTTDAKDIERRRGGTVQLHGYIGRIDTMAIEKEISVSAGRRTDEFSQGLVEDSGRVLPTGTGRAAEAIRLATGEIGSRPAEATRTGGDAAIRETENRSTEQVRRLLGLSSQDGEAVLSHASRNLDLMMRCGTVFVDGAQTIWREVVTTSKATVERRMSGLSQAASARSVSDLLAVQDRLAREELDGLIGSSRRMAEISVKIAQDAAERLADAASQPPRSGSDRA
jgi:hypothetical protein